jgi:hypothetical protein
MDAPTVASTDSAKPDPSDNSAIFHTVSSTLHPLESSANSTSVFDHDDSASDVSMSAETETDDEDTPIAQVTLEPHQLERKISLATPPTAKVDSSNKRKYSEPMDYIPNGHITPQEDRKRQKPDDFIQSFRTPNGILQQNKSLLPAEIWHHIFSFLHPRNLGILLRVNRSFHAYLTSPSSALSVTPLSKSVAQILTSDAIWRASRRLHLPGMPTPMKGRSELDMWKIACAASCQFCGKRPFTSEVSQDQWHPGPGENGVTPIWSFGIHTCGPCFQQRSEKVSRIYSLRTMSTTNHTLGNYSVVVV